MSRDSVIHWEICLKSRKLRICNLPSYYFCHRSWGNFVDWRIRMQNDDAKWIERKCPYSRTQEHTLYYSNPWTVRLNRWRRDMASNRSLSKRFHTGTADNWRNLFSLPRWWIFRKVVPSWPAVITVQWILISALFSTTIGVLFGLYPAIKAMRLSPIEALRAE